MSLKVKRHPVNIVEKILKRNLLKITLLIVLINQRCVNFVIPRLAMTSFMITYTNVEAEHESAHIVTRVFL